MNLRDINKKKYESALREYQEQIVQIAILEHEFKSLGEKSNVSKDAMESLRSRIEAEYDHLQVLAQAVTDAFNEFQDSDDIVAEEVNLDSLEFSERYYDILDRYEDQLEHIETLERELADLGERQPNASEEEFMAKRTEIDAAYDALAVLAANLSEEAEKDDKAISLDEIKEEVDKAIDLVEDDTLTDEDKEIMKAFEIEEIERLRKEIIQYREDIKANIRRKGELIRKDNAKEENLRGFDEAVRQLEERIAQDIEELKYYLAKHPEIVEEEKKKRENKKGLGFDELSRYIEGYLFMKSAGKEKVHTEASEPYVDQRNISITLNLGSGYTYHYNDARNPETGESYGYICWIAHRKDGRHITPEEFGNGANDWSNECDHVFQFRGDRRAGIQVQELVASESGKLHPLYVYETRNNKIVKGVVGETKLHEVSIATMLIEIDEKLNSVIKENVNHTVATDEEQFALDQEEIARLERENAELATYRNENEKRKILLLEQDNAKPEHLRGFDEAIRQINEEIKINEEIISTLKAKYPEKYPEEEVVIDVAQEEKPTPEEIEEAIEEALANVEKDKEEDNLEKEVLSLLDKKEIEAIIDKKLDELKLSLAEDNEDEMSKSNLENVVEVTKEEIAEEIDRKINEIELEETNDDELTDKDIQEVIGKSMDEIVIEDDIELTPEKVKEIIEEEMNNVNVELPVEYEEIFEGTYIIDERVTPEQQREKVFALMERAGLHLTDKEKEELEISYEGVEDNNGLSETQTTKFVVRRPLKKVPYKKPVYEDDYEQKEDTNEVVEETPTPEDKEDEKEYIQTMTPNGIELVEKITLYVDLDNSEVYGKDYLFKRFNMNRLSEKVVIDGFACYKMANDYVEYIIRNQNNNYSPYVVETREVRMGKKEVVEEEKPKVDEKTSELADEISIAERYMLILHPEYRDINKLNREEQRNLLIDYWYIRDNYKDIHNLFSKMKNYYSGADIDDKSLLISILPKYVVEQEMARRKERGEDHIDESEYKEAIYKGLANKDRYFPDWSYTETMLSDISNVNTRHIMDSQRTDNKVEQDFHVDKPEIQKPHHDDKLLYHREIAPLAELRQKINDVLIDYQRDRYSVDEAIGKLAKIFQENTNAINYSLEEVPNKDEVRAALMNIINNRNSLYEMCGIIVGELTDNDQIQYLRLEDAFKITDLEGEVYEDVVTYLMSTLLIQQTESQIIVDNKVVECIKSDVKVR